MGDLLVVDGPGDVVFGPDGFAVAGVVVGAASLFLAVGGVLGFGDGEGDPAGGVGVVERGGCSGLDRDNGYASSFG